MAKQQQQSQRGGGKPAQNTGNRGGGSGGGQQDAVDLALKKRLKAMNAKWEGSREESTKTGFGEGTTLSSSPSGVRHVCRLSGARLVMAKGEPCVVFEFTKTEGDEEIGEKAVRFCNFGKDEQIVYLQRDLRKLGVPVDDFNAEDLPAQLEQLVGEAPTVRITCKQNGEYINVYIDKLMAAGDESGGDSGGDAPGDDAGDAGNEDDTSGDETEADGAGDDSGDDGSDTETGEGDGEEEELPPDTGDKVAVIHKGKKVRGEVKKYDAKTKQIFAAIKGEPKLVPFKQWTILAA